MPRKKWPGRVYLGRGRDGKQQFHWLGRFDTKRERDLAVAKALTERPWERHPITAITGDQLADRYLERYAKRNKASSLTTATYALRKFRAEFGDQPITSITAVDAEDWAERVKPANVPPAVAVMNYAVKLKLRDDNPFDGLGTYRTRGRRDQPPPTLDQLAVLRDACDVLKDYADPMRDLMDFAAYTLMRPGELYELRHPDIDIVANRIEVSRRVYLGVVDLPKNNQPKTIALVPPARAIVLRQPTRTRDDGLVWVTKTGVRLSANTASKYWTLVQARANLSFDFYHATKHYGVHLLYKLGLSKRAIGAQAGWSEETVDQMLRIYGHTDLVALAEVDALYQDLGDASVTQETPDVA